MPLLPTQRRFIRCVDPFPAYIGGYGAGKTFVGAVLAILHAAHRNPGLSGLLIAPTYRDLRDTNLPTLTELLDRFGFPAELHRSHMVLTLPWWGSRILLRSADDPEALKGPNVAWAGIDEVARIDESIWGVAVSRVRDPRAGCRQVFATGTPEGLNWVFDRWVEHPADGYRLFQASTAENFFVGASYLAALRASHDEDELRQKLNGQFTETARGRVYKPFERSAHLRDVSPLDPRGAALLVEGLPLCLACDFNVDPCCWLAIQHRSRLVYVALEIVLRDTSTPEMLAEFRARGLHTFPSGVIVYGDPAGNARSTVASSSDYAILRDGGLARQNVARAAPEVRDRVHAVNALLRGDAAGPKLFVNPACVTLIRDLERVKWKEGATGVLDKSDRELTHASDALGYFIHREYALTKPKAPRRMKVAEVLRRQDGR